MLGPVMMLKEEEVAANTSLGTASILAILPSIGWRESFRARVSVNSGRVYSGGRVKPIKGSVVG